MTRVHSLVLALVAAVSVPAVQAAEPKVPVKLPAHKEGAYVHTAPTLDELNADEGIHPELRKVILKGRELFMNTQQLRGKYVFNDLNCRNCHIGGGGYNWSGPIWPAATTLPDFRGKNGHVNSLEERIAGCFSYSMNGTPPDYGSDEMLALSAYHQWLATKAPVYERRISGRGFGTLGQKIPEDVSYEAGEAVYRENCALCHGDDGAGKLVDGRMVFPALWGDGSYNWGAGIARVYTAASFIHLNMPLGKPGSLSAKEAWDAFNNLLSRAMNTIALITIPVTLFFLVSGESLIILLFKTRSFSDESVSLTLQAFVWHIPGLYFIAANRILAPAFYARSDTRSPTLAGILSFVVNITLALALVGPLRGGGIALALSAASAVNTVLLVAFLGRSRLLAVSSLVRTSAGYAVKMIIFSLIAAAPIYLIRTPLYQFFAGSNRLYSQGIPLMISLVIFGGIGMTLLLVTRDQLLIQVVNLVRNRGKKS